MRVPPRRRRAGWRALATGTAGRCGVAAMLLLAAAAHAADRPPVVYVKLPLETLGVSGVSNTQLSAGASLLTVHFLDTSHLLVTFGTHGLVRRLENDPKDDQDRMLAAEIVELPSGKVLAKEEWQVHDHGRYLWNLGKGRFLLRVGMEFFAIEPLAHLAAGRPFARARVAAFQRPSMILVSPDQNLITLQTRVRVNRGAQQGAQWGDVPQENVPVTTMVEFFRMHGGGVGEQPFSLELAGRVLTPQPVFLPISGDGVLYAEPKGKRKHWQVSFEPFAGEPGSQAGGQPLKAGELDSGCDPQLQLVSRSEFVAMVCRMGTETPVLQAYAFDGHEAWEEPLSGMDDPVFATAPDAGRFALLRRLEPVVTQGKDGLPSTLERQELRVYQTESGDLLLKAELAPAFKSAENFDLARDGSLAVAVKDRALMVYKLPAPDKQELADMALAAKSAPPVVERGMVKLPAKVEVASLEPGAGGATPRVAAPATEAGKEAAKGGRSGEAAVAAAANQAAAAAKSAQAVAAQKPPMRADTAEAVTKVRRTPPTLLKPGEKPEFGKANPQPVEAGNGEGPK